MTPLARKVANELTLPVKKRSIIDRCGLLGMMDDIHCFELSQVTNLIDPIMHHIMDHGPDERSTFLPAPKTWIELTENQLRHAYLLVQMPDSDAANVFHITLSPRQQVFAPRLSFQLDLADHPKPIGTAGFEARITAFESASLKQERLTANDIAALNRDFLLACLAIINTPRIVGRRQHMPHRGLERRLARAMGPQGRFPLHAWTEIRLEVSPPENLSGQASTEAHLTGQKALHFCRAHLRVRRGRLEVVRGHWRGDASLGIRQSRYSLTDRGNGAATLQSDGWRP